MVDLENFRCAARRMVEDVDVVIEMSVERRSSPASIDR